ncbi:hypothetical protein [Streptomyces sp. NPDC057460]|uniref:hypothetical protein n=1 Tax=Streptomyces sp. NPDC057460 TaxID=3346141 RepID=UPI0036AF6232
MSLVAPIAWAAATFLGPLLGGVALDHWAAVRLGGLRGDRLSGRRRVLAAAAGRIGLRGLGNHRVTGTPPRAGTDGGSAAM